jgi:uncharacterized protein DUF4865
VGFTAIIRDFGRPSVQTWIGGTSRTRLEGSPAAQFAVRTTASLADDADIVAAAASADDRSAAAIKAPGVLLAAYGIDPRTWQLVTFTLHSEHPAALPEGSAVFQVLHLSAPEQQRLPGRVDTRMAVPR